MSETGFIMLRHVNSELTNKYWNICYDCIRTYYPEHAILIIDDFSNYQYINERTLYKTTILKSEYKGRGELLPYYYFLHNKLFDTAVILHDSVFINKLFDISVDKYKILWDFIHNWDQIDDETKMIKLFNDTALLDFYTNKTLWTGCFGGMSIITHDHLVSINDKHDLSKLLDYVLTRFNRMSFERVIACLLQFSAPKTVLYGDIMKYGEWQLQFKDKDRTKHLPLTKVWSGR